MTDKKEISEIKTVSMREYFEHEEDNFTPWLRDNIERLSSDELLKLRFDEVNEEENVVDRKKADLVAKDSDGDLTAVIENQFEESDSDHLGRLLLYAAAEDADIAVWIAEDLLERHKKTIRWLNSNSNKDTAFFALEVSLRRIGDSPYAVEFQTHERPDDWEEQVENKYLSSEARRRLEFWQEFKRKCEEYGIEGGEPNEKASHSVYIFRNNKRPAYVRPTIPYSGPVKNMIRFYDDSRDILRVESNQSELETVFEQTISEIETELTPELVSSIDYDIDNSNQFDKMVIKNQDINQDNFKKDQEIKKAHQWMVDTTRVLQDTLIELAQRGKIEAEPRRGT